MRFPLVINRGKSPTNGSLWRKRSQHGGVAIAMLDYQRGIRNWTCNKYGRVQQILLICQAAFPARIVDIDYTKPQKHASWTAGKYGGEHHQTTPLVSHWNRHLFWGLLSDRISVTAPRNSTSWIATWFFDRKCVCQSQRFTVLPMVMVKYSFFVT